MYHHRYQPPPHLATNKTNSAYASNNNHALNSYPSSSSSTSIAGAATAVVVSPPNSSRPFVTKSTRNNNNNNGLYLGLSKHYIAERQDVIFRKVRGILNKITPETFDKLSKELVNVGLDSPRTLRGVIYLLFDKALKDLKYSSLYAKLCQELSEKAPNFEQEPGPNTFCKFLISKCEDEFERRRKASEDFENKNELTDEEYEQKAIVKQKMLGNIKFICELGKKRLLQEEILHECIRGLLSKKKERPIQDQAQDLECLCQIMRTIGSLLDVQASRNLMNQYFERIDLFSKKPELPPRIRFMLRDCIDLRNNNWRPRPFQREDNVPQPLSKLREEAGYDQHSNSTIDKYGNNSGGFLGMGDTSKSSENKLSALLHQHHYDDDEPSFTTSTDFHWGPTFLDQPTFDPFSSNSRHMTNHNLKQQQQQPQQQHQQHRQAPQKQPLTRQQHPQPPPPQQQQQPPQQHRQAPQKQPFMRMQQQQQFQPQPQQQQQQPQQHRQAPQKQPFVRLQQQQHQPQQQQPQQHQPPPHIVQTLNPLLPKPPTKLSDTNFSLRPSHNLAGRVHSSGPSSNGQQSSTFNKQNQPNLDSIGKENHHQDQNFKPVTRFQERAQALPPPSTLPPVSLGNHGTSSEGSKVVASSGPASDFYTNKFISALTECFNESAMNTNITRVAAKVKELKIPKEYQHECLVRAMKEAILKGEKDRENIGKLFNQLIPSSFESPALMNAFKIIFEQMHSLEVETPKVKSLVAGFLSQATLDGLSTLEEVGKVLSGGKHHPLFLLYLQKLEKSAGQAWLNEKFVASKINLMDMLPEADKSKDRLASVLKDRCLGFLDPMLTIEPDLWEQMKEKDSSPASIYRWIKDNVDQSIQNTPTFAHVLISCLLRYVHNLAKASLEQKDGDSGVAEQSSNKSSPSSSTLQSIGDIEKEILAKYQQVLQATLKDKRMQLATLYALQSFYHKLDFPKGSLLRWFHMLYDMNIVDDDVFFVWKEEINDEIPGKGQALFQVNTWLNWLAEAESEEEDDDEENA